LIHSYNQFHAAGHGTFFSGILAHDRKSPPFVWVYDCGSKRSGRIPALVEDLAAHASSDQIALFCVSHFDADHVNGMTALLARFRVDVLALPYLPFDRRLEIACGLDPDNEASADASLFALDPVGFLAIRELGARVRRVVLVQGGGDGPVTPPNEPGEDPILPRQDVGAGDDSINQRTFRLEMAVRDIDPPYDSDYPSLLMGDASGRSSVGTRLALTHHSRVATIAGGLWEFSFYNKDIPGGKTPKSGVSLKQVQQDVLEILERYNLATAGVKAAEGWRKELRKCYDKHFGDDSIARNDISLCVLSRPVLARDVVGCLLFDMPASRLSCAHSLIPAPAADKLGLLLTGDISLDAREIHRMSRHFGDPRWGGIIVMQIPHHGSQHSWKAGLAGVCPQDFSVLCVPDSDKLGHHPHPDVLADMVDKNPVRADYSNSVIFCFHTRE
jgi:hypothetical protein